MIPFDLIGKLIAVEAVINGKNGRFIIDTGAETLVLNSRYFSGLKNKEEVAKNFAGSNIKIGNRLVRFSWDGEVEQKMLAAIADLKLLEKQLGLKLMGYIGYEALKEYELIFDFQNKEIGLFALDQRGRRKSSSTLHARATKVFDIKPNGFMPYLHINLGACKLKLGLDSGAALNLFKPEVSKKLKNRFTAEEIRSVLGFDGREIKMSSQWLKGFELNGLNWPAMRCLIVDLKHINDNLRADLDGILGFDFLSRYKIGFNYKKNELYVWN